MSVSISNMNGSFDEAFPRILGKMGEPLVVVGIPLKAKVVSRDWKQVQRNLDATVKSLKSQTDGNFIAVICGHDKPELIEFGENILWLPANWAAPVDVSGYSHDKTKKRRWILIQCRKKITNGIYFYTLDADDLVVSDLVSYIRKNNNGRGYLIDKGYAYNKQTGEISKLDNRSRSFDSTCGSCGIFWLRRDDMPKRISDKDNFSSRLYDHTGLGKICQEEGRPLDNVPFYAAMYVVNHGSNNTLEKASGVNKIKQIDRFRIKGVENRGEVLSKFPSFFDDGD